MDDDAFMAAFDGATIPKQRWRHRDHVRAAWLHLARAPFDEALPRLRAGIRRLNAAHGVVEAVDRGYHETLTHAWLRLVDTTRRAHGPEVDSDAFCDRHPHLLAPTLLRLYYTRDRIVSPEAKRRFVEPDLAPLPRVGAGLRRAT